MPQRMIMLSEGVNECHIKTPTQKTELLCEKVLLLVGTQGQGKSTLINRMINHIFGVEYTNKFRFQLVDEKETTTTCITKYTIYNSKLNFIVSIIDTPGFGDTSGIEANEEKITKLRKLFESDTLVSIDAICFVANHNNNRLTEFERYNYKAIISLFAKDISANCFIMTTFCDDVYDENNEMSEPPVLNMFRELKIPFVMHFSFNNRYMFNEPNTHIRDSMYLEAWKTSEISCSLFFGELAKTYSVSLRLTLEVNQMQHNTDYIQIPMFVGKVQQYIHTVDKYQKALEKLQELRDLPNMGFTSTVLVQKKVMVDITECGIYSIVCNNCPDMVCHYPCDIPSNREIKNCSVFTKKFSDKDICTMCPKNCPWTQHIRLKQRPKYIMVSDVHRNTNLEHEYLMKNVEHQSQKAQLAAMLKSCEAELISAYDSMLKVLKNIQQNIDFLNQKCLCITPITLEKKIHKYVKNFSKDRDTHMRQILENLLSTMRQANIFEDFEWASEEDKLRQAKHIAQI